jgi:DNA (cytosine-5)-methyltransferase 1
MSQATIGFRKAELTEAQQLKAPAIPVIDLFSGLGGLSLGAVSAGGDVRLLLDADPIACASARANPQFHAGAAVVEGDVSKVSGPELREMANLGWNDPLVIIGGPPCQPFSKAAYWTDPGDDSRYRQARARGEEAHRPSPITEARPDQRRSLVEEYWRLIEETRADGFLFENVPSLLHPRSRGIAKALIGAAEVAGFHVRMLRAKAVEYGVPQRRERVFIMGSRTGRPGVPRASHTEDPESLSLGLASAVTAGEALAPCSSEDFFEPEEVVEGRWASLLREIPPGMNYKHHTAWAGHPSPTFVTETRFWSFLLKLSPDQPSWTIAANPGPWVGPFHWASRRLRTCELAALQGFPAQFRILGNRRERVRQIGNAVPPPLARKMVQQTLLAIAL